MWPAGNNIVNNIGPVFRTFVPMIVYFTVMWTSAFAAIFWLTRWREQEFGYEMAVVQAFTAGKSRAGRLVPRSNMAAEP